MNTLSKLMGISLLMASSLAAAADAAMPNLKPLPAEAAAKPAAKPKEIPKPANSSSSQRWSSNQEATALLKQELEILELQRKISQAEQSLPGAGPVSMPAPPSGDMPQAGAPSSEIFVDRVFGLEGDLQARVFFDSHIMTVRVNDEITNGIVVAGINSRGVALRAGRRIQFVPLTTTTMAAEKAFPSGFVMGVSAHVPSAGAFSGGRQLPPGAFPAGVLGMPSPPPISTGP